MCTIREVAKRAGVSPATVSRVINQSGPVKEETRQRVEVAIAELEYVPNRLATSLRSRKTHMIGLLSPSDLMNPFWIQVVQGVEVAIAEQGFHMILSNSGMNEAKEERILKSLLERQVDGFILRPVNNRAAPVRLVQSQGVPVVVIDYQMPDVEVDVVRGDSRGGACQLTRLLLELGHQRIALLNGPLEVSVARMRRDGYEQALKEAGLQVDPTLVFSGRFTYESGYQMAEKAMDLIPRPTALFATNNGIALGVLKALRDRTLHIPGDVSVVGFDELRAGSTEHTFLTVAEQSAYEIGQRAAELLMQRISGDGPTEAQEVVLPVKVVYRESCGSCFRHSLFCSP